MSNVEASGWSGGVRCVRVSLKHVEVRLNHVGVRCVELWSMLECGVCGSVCGGMGLLGLRERDMCGCRICRTVVCVCSWCVSECGVLECSLRGNVGLWCAGACCV